MFGDLLGELLFRGDLFGFGSPQRRLRAFFWVRGLLPGTTRRIVRGIGIPGVLAAWEVNPNNCSARSAWPGAAFSEQLFIQETCSLGNLHGRKVKKI